MATAGAASILHADLDAFYASVEQLLDPELRGRPVAVGGGVVLAASYEARAMGVASGMPGWRARRLCPDLRFAGGHFGEYQRLGDQVMAVLRDFTPVVERVSIDEAFLDVTGAARLFGSPGDIAEAIRRRVRNELGLPISVGVARTKHLAKVASQVAKPDGLVVVHPSRERAFLDPLPIGLIWGVGPATRERLHAFGIHTIGELTSARVDLLERLLGAVVGGKLQALAANTDPRAVVEGARAKSVGAQAALGRRRATPELLTDTFAYLADRVAGRLRGAGRAGRTVTVRVRFPGLRSVTRARTLAVAISATRTLTDVACELAAEALAEPGADGEVSLLAVSVANLVDERALQLELPLGLDGEPHRPGAPSGAARWGVDRSMDAIRERFGHDAVGYARTVLSGEEGVPEAFRELAERDLRR